jgi:hypothetical protein
MIKDIIKEKTKQQIWQAKMTKEYGYKTIRFFMPIELKPVMVEYKKQVVNAWKLKNGLKVRK